MLHIINKSPFDKNSLKNATNFIDDNSVIILIEDGVIAATTNSKFYLIDKLVAKAKVYALINDVKARGLETKIMKNIKTVDYEGFVDLVIKYGTSVSWL